MEEPLHASRVVGIFPLSVASSPPTARQADLCRGFGMLIDRQFAQVSGVGTQLQQLFVAPDSDPASRGWLVNTSTWTLDQINAFPFHEDAGVTHVIHGGCDWQEDDATLTLELVDLAQGEVVERGSIAAPPEQAIREFFQILGDFAYRILSPLPAARAAVRVVGRPVTENPEAFENLLLSLAWAQGFHNGMCPPGQALKYAETALKQSPGLLMASELLEEFHRAGEEQGGTLQEETRATLERVVAEQQAPRRLGALLGLQLAQTGNTADRGKALLESYLAAERRGPLASRALLTLAGLPGTEQARSRQLLESAVQAHPEDATAWEHLATLCEQEGAIVRAEDCLRRALQEDPDRPDALVRLARLLRQRGNLAGAVDLAARALQQRFSPTASEICTAGALAVGDIDLADRLATDWAEQEPQDLQAWMTLAEVRCRREDMPAAWFAIGQAARLATTPAERAEIDFQQFRIQYPQAYSILCQARELLAGQNPPSRASLLLAARRLQEGKPVEAGNRWALETLVDIYTRLQQPADAILCQLKLVEMSGHEGERVLALAQLYRSAGRPTDALATVQHLIGRTGANAALLELVGDMEGDRGKYAEAADAYERALALPDCAPSVRRKLIEVRHRASLGRPAHALVDPALPSGGILRRMLALMRRLGR